MEPVMYLRLTFWLILVKSFVLRVRYSSKSQNVEEVIQDQTGHHSVTKVGKRTCGTYSSEERRVKLTASFDRVNSGVINITPQKKYSLIAVC
jgi:hypothetical protein